jgi:hypothetical protein
MRRLFAAVIGASCCAAAAYADEPRVDMRVQPSPALFLTGEATTEAFLGDDLEPLSNLVEPFRSEEGEPSYIEDLTVIANKVAYIGSFILTADQVIRSMDSVMNRMAYTYDDGTVLRLKMRPSTGGFKVMLRLSRPIDF